MYTYVYINKKAPVSYEVDANVIYKTYSVQVMLVITRQKHKSKCLTVIEINVLKNWIGSIQDLIYRMWLDCKHCLATYQRYVCLPLYQATWCYYVSLNSLRPRQNRRHFADDVFKYNFLNENVWIPIKISLNFVPSGPINDMSALVQIMAWRRPGDRPLSEPMMDSLPTHICVTRPQWV